jgi:glutamyl-Q tRNA(Asp) synthetase
MYVTRFAPSPTGALHLGNAFSALFGWQRARAKAGRFLLRIEDIDTTRCRPAHAAALIEDLRWLGLDWDGPVWRQSERLGIYAEALARLQGMGLAYPCFCTRADIAAAASAPHGPEGAVYPATCRGMSDTERGDRMAHQPFAWRLDVASALAQTGPLWWVDAEAGRVAADPVAGGDIVIARKDIGTSYTLAVVVDDAAQGVTEVVRGRDLFEATHVQRLLQALLGLPEPGYCHHRLIIDVDGKRMAKRDGATSIREMREAGATQEMVREMLGA